MKGSQSSGVRPTPLLTGFPLRFLLPLFRLLSFQKNCNASAICNNTSLFRYPALRRKASVGVVTFAVLLRGYILREQQAIIINNCARDMQATPTH